MRRILEDKFLSPGHTFFWPGVWGWRLNECKIVREAGFFLGVEADKPL